MKQTASILKFGYADEIVLIGVWKPGLLHEEQIDEKRRIVRIKEAFKFSGGLAGFVSRYIFFQYQVIRFLRKKRLSFVNCHNLSVLGIGVYLKIFRKVPLIYDAHELETEVDGARGIKKTIGKWLERFYINYVDEVIVVSNRIADWYKKRYGLKRVTVVRNVPYQFPLDKDNDTLREKFSISPDKLVFIYQGLLSMTRGVNVILDAFKCNRTHQIVFMGMGEMVQEIKSAAADYDNVFYLPAVPPLEVHRYTSSADVGIHLIQNTCLNHYYCAPNKIFEYLLYGIPQIISNFPEMMEVISNDKHGWGIHPSINELASLLKKIKHEDVLEKKRNVIEARQHWGWHYEELNMLDAYKYILSKSK